MPDVRVRRDGKLDWAVWLEGRLVRRYTIVGDALAYASLLECDPRERSLAQTA